MIGTILAWLAALALLALGTGALGAPRPSSDGYGIPSTDRSTLAYVRALGARDLALGAIVVAFLIAKMRAPLEIVVGLTAIVGAADALIVARAGGARRSLAVHSAGTAGLVALWLALRAGW